MPALLPRFGLSSRSWYVEAILDDAWTVASFLVIRFTSKMAKQPLDLRSIELRSQVLCLSVADHPSSSPVPLPQIHRLQHVEAQAYYHPPRPHQEHRLVVVRTTDRVFSGSPPLFPFVSKLTLFSSRLRPFALSARRRSCSSPTHPRSALCSTFIVERNEC